jgi:hypothetical protein
MAINGRLLLVAVLIAGFTVGMAFLLISFKVENTHRDLRHTRFELIARDVERVIEQNLLLGMNVDEMTTLPAALERRRLADSAILSIDVSDETGKLIYSTDANRVPGPSAVMPPSWLAAIRQQRILQTKKNTALLWRLAGDSESVAGTSAENSFGITKSFVAVRYTGAEGVTAREALREALLPIAWATFAATAVALFSIMLLLARRFNTDTALAHQYLTRSGGSAPPPPPRDGWETILPPLQQRFADADAALADWQRLVTVPGPKPGPTAGPSK